jgi:hypothetical protein
MSRPVLARACAALVASLALALAAALPACSSPSCDQSVLLSSIAMQRTLDLPADQLDRAAIDVCVGATCVRAGVPDASGAQALPYSVGVGSGQLSVAAAADGRAIVTLSLVLSERTGSSVVQVVAHDRGGAAHSASGTVTFHAAAGGCHGVADSTSI